MAVNEAEKQARERRQAKVLLIATGILALIFVVFLAFKLLGQESQQTSAAVEAAPPSVVPEEAALPPLFQDAEACFSRCTAKYLSYQQRGRLPLPYQFVDLIKKARFRATFHSLIAGFPADYAGLSQLSADDFEGLEFEGSTDLAMTTADGRQIQIYDGVGYPQRHGDNEATANRPAGRLTVAVDAASGEMAGIFNGPDDLSNYRFSGSKALFAPLLAYHVADQVFLAKLQKLGFPENGPKLTFPLVDPDLAATRDRLRYLAAHFENGQIVSAQTLDGIQEANDDAAGRSWYTYNSSRTACFKTGGPAEKLREFVGFTDQPTTNDFRDENGDLTKVEVVNAQDNGNEVVWTFYRHQADCERDWVTRNEDLANKYR